MGCPVWVGATDAVGAEEGGAAWAGVGGFEGIHARGLDEDGIGGNMRVHGTDDHTGYLGGYDVIGYSVDYFGGRFVRQEMEKVVVDFE